MVEKTPNSQDFATVIGKDAKFKGELSFEGGVRVDGELEGSVTTKGQVLVSQGGTLKAEVKAGSVSLEGTLEGNVTANDRVELRATGTMQGDIKAATLKVVEGATFVGRCEVGPGAKGGGAVAPKSNDADKARAAVAAAAAGRK